MSLLLDQQSSVERTDLGSPLKPRKMYPENTFYLQYTCIYIHTQYVYKYWALTPVTVGKESSLFCQGPFNINRKVFVFLNLHLSESIGYSLRGAEGIFLIVLTLHV